MAIIFLKIDVFALTVYIMTTILDLAEWKNRNTRHENKSERKLDYIRALAPYFRHPQPKPN